MPRRLVLALASALLVAVAPALAQDDCANCMPKGEEALLHARNATGDFGAGARDTTPVALSTILDSPKTYLDREVTVEGLVVQVCAKRGCWMEISGDRPYETIKAKVCDGAIVFPLSARGKTARVTGLLRAVPLDRKGTVAHLAAIAKTRGEKFDLESVREPITIYQLQATGLTLK